ncbi:hypothetical protein TNCV_2313461 [Trichonephila clavipes]|nr:hypothetical protein TNCV_2313461 [Trichonephila clavipes]
MNIKLKNDIPVCQRADVYLVLRNYRFSSGLHGNTAADGGPAVMAVVASPAKTKTSLRAQAHHKKVKTLELKLKKQTLEKLGIRAGRKKGRTRELLLARYQL